MGETFLSNSLLMSANISYSYFVSEIPLAFWLKFNFLFNCTCFTSNPVPNINQDASGSKFRMPLKDNKLPAILFEGGAIATQFGFFWSQLAYQTMS